jgi:hypothetical protein
LSINLPEMQVIYLKEMYYNNIVICKLYKRTALTLHRSLGKGYVIRFDNKTRHS